MGYGKYLEERGGDLRKAEILEALGQYEATPQGLLDRLQVLYQMIQAGGSGEGGKITLSTIHSSKGLEYPHVILMDLVEGIFPKVSNMDPGEEAVELYQEERRLFYVAMTRAKDELWVLSFQEDGLTSSFTRELFPPQHQEATQTRAEQKFQPGDRVRHKIYGDGIIQNRVGDIATITFASAGEKRLSLSTANKHRLLESE